MLTSSKAIGLIAVLALLGVVLSARLYAATITPQIGGGISQFDGGVASSATVIGPQPTGFILQTDNTSRILQIDGTSRICRAGGC